MSGKRRALTVTAATAGFIALWLPTAMASTISASPSTSAPTGDSLVSGVGNVYLGSGNTAVGNTCNNINETAPVAGDLLTWALPISQNACVMAGGPAHF